jgi:hypothetical protein
MADETLDGLITIRKFYQKPIRKNLMISIFCKVHERKEPFKCSICDTSFGVPFVIVHERKKLFKCSICDTSFGVPFVIVHERKKPFKCSICNTNFCERGLKSFLNLFC